jgi:hypothetical protein
MYFALIFFKFLNSLIRVDLNAIKSSFLISSHDHAFIPDYRRKDAFSWIGVFENDLV